MATSYSVAQIKEKVHEIAHGEFAERIAAEGFKPCMSGMLFQVNGAFPKMWGFIDLPKEEKAKYKNPYNFLYAICEELGLTPIVEAAPVEREVKAEPAAAEPADPFTNVPTSNKRLPIMREASLEFSEPGVEGGIPAFVDPATDANEEDNKARAAYLSDKTWCGRVLSEHDKVLKDYGNLTCLTRFPPEPNGYLHIGHAKSMFLNFNYAKQHNGKTILRFDDTNPEKENVEFVESIKADVHWMGHEIFKTTFTSSYFPRLYAIAVEFIKAGLAYVDDQTDADMKLYRGTKPDGTQCEPRDPPCRFNSIETNLREFQRMKDGFYREGERTLRLKIDMRHANPTMRDPVAYRIKFCEHHRTGTEWCIYPSYDFSHCLIDSFEDITHSMCTLEFQIRQIVYNYVTERAKVYLPMQWEFNRLNLTQTVMSKRKLLQLVTDKHVRGWDDPRMPTIRGLRRRGFTPAALNALCAAAGVTRSDSQTIRASLLERCVREDLDASAPRAFAVVSPVKVVIENFAELLATHPDSATVEGDAIICTHPLKVTADTYTERLTSELFIEESDFMATPTKGFLRLFPGGSVGLRFGPTIQLAKEGAVFTEGGMTVLRVTGVWGATPSKFIHWVSAADAVPAEVRLYGPLFEDEKPDLSDGWEKRLNPDSLVVKRGYVSRFVAETARIEGHYQFERLGFFVVDKDTVMTKGKVTSLVVNRTVGLRDSFK
ncbi:Glutamyl/glutaminyl-tRNA synthetase [Carpediemonas membranifera]|uniref:glutamine--tRNA ligase n=1 Tax=Carpediemonas membranifera TaxID=201153 RepID=A0A8J6AWV2_9EUKA|nr:Glutamyl/glutaminyl-tRNA synthetase [Carpediemonas membranifera]|eukprot:KAG9393555.1 Glutamyl/glutaminyl-tRNA synthetase [Carpediemonas membranifera]